MNRVEQILKDVDIYDVFSASYKEYAFKMMEQTALEFTKWKDENYAYRHGEYVSWEKNIKGVMILVPKTSEQLFNEWNNLNK